MLLLLSHMMSFKFTNEDIEIIFSSKKLNILLSTHILDFHSILLHFNSIETFVRH